MIAEMSEERKRCTYFTVETQEQMWREKTLELAAALGLTVFCVGNTSELEPYITLHNGKSGKARIVETFRSWRSAAEALYSRPLVSGT